MTPATNAGKDLAYLLVVFGGLGVIAGLLWWLVTPLPYYAAIGGQVSMDSVQLMKRANSDVYFILISVGAGVLGGLATATRRVGNPLLWVLLILIGSGLASIVMWQFGELLSPRGLSELLKQLKPGQTLVVPLRLEAKPALLALPATALCVTTAVLWIRPIPLQALVEVDSAEPDRG